MTSAPWSRRKPIASVRPFLAAQTSASSRISWGLSEGCQAGKLTLLAGYRWSGGFRNALGALRAQGLIEGSNTGTMRITAAGAHVIDGEADALPHGRDLVRYWLNHSSFGTAERKILQAIIERHEGLTREELMEATGYGWSGGFRNALGTLRTAGVLVGRNNERMRACPELLEA